MRTSDKRIGMNRHNNKKEWNKNDPSLLRRAYVACSYFILTIKKKNRKNKHSKCIWLVCVVPMIQRWIIFIIINFVEKLVPSTTTTAYQCETAHTAHTASVVCVVCVVCGVSFLYSYICIIRSTSTAHRDDKRRHKWINFKLDVVLCT